MKCPVDTRAEMKNLSAYFLVLGFLSMIALPVRADESSWTADPARVQLNQDPTLIPRGKGFLFVPAMTTSRNEPSYQVFRGENEIASAKPGTGILLAPGSYQVLIGSGTSSQMMRKTVPIVEGNTTLLNPDWAGLVIDVIDETRTSINESYELFEDGSQENYGLGLGVEEERGEAVDTWLLKPGVYTVVKVGENVTTIRRYSVHLLPGELTRRNLVVDSGTNDFIGFYPQRQVQGIGQISKNWKTTWELSGSSLFNTSQHTAGGDRSSISLSVQVFNRTRYSTKRNFATLRLTLEEGGTKEGSDAFRKSIDKVEFRATYIYRFSQLIGPYLRGVLNTKLFASDVRFDEPRMFAQLDAAGDTLATFLNATEITLSPSFYPLRLRQGLGINSQLIQSFPLNVDLRFGVGARQTYVSDSFELGGDGSSATRLRKATSTGLEALLITDARLGRFVDLNSEFDLLVPSRNIDFWVFSWENRWRIFLTSFINLDIVVDFEREETRKRLESREQVLLRFSKFL